MAWAVFDSRCRGGNHARGEQSAERAAKVAFSRRYCEAVAANLGDPLTFSQALHCLSRASGDAAALAFYADHRARFATLATDDAAGDKAVLALLRANVAWLLVKAGGSEWTAEAERLARAAALAMPDAPEMKGTLGAVLVMKGEVDAGLILLRDAARRVTDPVDKADFCTFLAKGERERGNAAMAQGFDDLRQHILARG